MKLNNRLSSTLHALLHMQAQQGVITSATLAKYLNTNAVVVRRTMAGLRTAGLVQSIKGKGGGWSLSCDFDNTTLGDIYQALDAPQLFAMADGSDVSQCLVEQSVNAALKQTFSAAAQLIIEQFNAVTLRQLSNDFERRLHHHKKTRKQKHAAI